MRTPPRFRCSKLARWLPRCVAAAVLIASYSASTRIHVGSGGWSSPRTLVVLLGAALALLLVRAGASVRSEFEIGTLALKLFHGPHTRELPYEQIVSMNYEAPFSRGREWLPALVLIDRFERRWRVPALIGDGARLVSELVVASKREDLGAFAEAYDLERKMRHSRRRGYIGYVVVVLLVLAAIVFSMSDPGGALP